MRVLFVFVFIMSGLILSNCKKDKDDNPPPYKKLLISKIRYNGKISEDFIYKKDTLVQINFYNELQVLSSHIIIIYDSTGKLSNINGYDITGLSKRIVLHRKDHSQIMPDYAQVLYQDTFTAGFQYNNNVITMITFYEDTTINPLSYFSNWELMYNNNNLITLKCNFKNSNLNMIYSYEFDNMYNPYYVEEIRLPMLLIKSLLSPIFETSYCVSQNNFLKLTDTHSVITNYSFQYNSDGYPIRYSDDGGTNNYDIEYK